MSGINNNILIIPPECNIHQMSDIRDEVGQHHLRRCFIFHRDGNFGPTYYRAIVFSQNDKQFYAITLAYPETRGAGYRYDMKILPIDFNHYPIGEEWLLPGTEEEILDWDRIKVETIDEDNFNGSYCLFHTIYDDYHLYFNDFSELYDLLDSFNLTATGAVIPRPSLPVELTNLEYLERFDLNHHLINFIIPLEPTSGERTELNDKKADLISYINNNFFHQDDTVGVFRYLGQDVDDDHEEQNVVTPFYPGLQPSYE